MERISVAIRVRPGREEGVVKGSHWVVDKNTVTLCNCYGAPVPGCSYAFDRVFATKATNSDVYNVHAKEVIVSAIEGFNGTVFAYGQTSSGKTYTMQGTDAQPGIIRQAVHEVFHGISQVPGREYLIRVSYLEIYNEDINDLLAPENRKLQIHENLERGVFVAALREEIVNCPEQVMDFLKFGESHRHFGQTNMNLYSSRSHTIFRMVIESRDKHSNTDAVRVSTLNLVDLAGSERVAKTGAGGTRLKEGTHINKSLMTLGTVINKLSEGPGNRGHIPYRDSKLTRILQSALSGNAKTAIICTVTPDEVHIDETRGTLQFASRAKKIATCAHVNEVLTDAALLKRQRREIEELRQKLQGLRSEEFEKQLLTLRNDLLKYELEKEQLALELEEERRKHGEREKRIKEQEQKIENLTTIALSPRQEKRANAKRPRFTQSCTQQEFTRTCFEDLNGRGSMISTRRERDRCVTPVPEFDALIRSESGPGGNNFGKDDSPQALQFGVEDACEKMNKEEEADAEQTAWMQERDDEWLKLNTSNGTPVNTMPFTPCVKSNKNDLLEFQLKELQLQYEELEQQRMKDAESFKAQLCDQLQDHAQAKKNFEALMSENLRLQETNKELEENCKVRIAQAQVQCEHYKKQVDERMQLSSQQAAQVTDLTRECADLRQAIETLETSLLQEKESSHDREQVAIRQIEETMMQLKDTMAKNTVLQQSIEDKVRAYETEKLQLIERLRMSEEHVNMLEQEVSVSRLEAERTSRILALQIERNEALTASMEEDRLNVAHELKRYMDALSYQHESMSVLCSTIKELEDSAVQA